jgi:hypothetical protein
MLRNQADLLKASTPPSESREGFDQILVRRDFTPAQIKNAGSYHEGDVIHCAGTRVQQRQGIRKDSYVTVEAVNRSAKTLILRAKDGRRLEACPIKWNDTDHVAAEVY